MNEISKHFKKTARSLGLNTSKLSKLSNIYTHSVRIIITGIFCYICACIPSVEMENLFLSLWKRHILLILVSTWKTKTNRELHTLCAKLALNIWDNGQGYRIPMVWREPRNHHEDCYFCLVNINGGSFQVNSTWGFHHTLPDLHDIWVILETFSFFCHYVIQNLTDLVCLLLILFC